MHNNLGKSYTPSQAWSVVILHIGMGTVQHKIKNTQDSQRSQHIRY